MREILPRKLWIGDAGDLQRPAALELAGIKAVVQVALAEPIPSLSRELLVAHFPIVDGVGNEKGMLTGAIDLVVSLVRSSVPTLVCCSGGMSRSPCICSAAMAIALRIEIDDALQQIIRDQPHDVSPALWEAVRTICTMRR